MKSIFPAAIDGDLLKLVHLSNGTHFSYNNYLNHDNGHKDNHQHQHHQHVT